MALSPRLELRQSQSLVMTPQLQQAIKLLQMSNLELAAFVADAVERNPLMELAPLPAPAPRPARAAGAGGGDAGFLESLPERPSLREHLRAQIGTMRAGPAAREAALILADEIEEDGYLRAPPAEVMARHRLGAGALAAGLRLVQACDPAGVGARSLAECLALQLRERDRLDPAMQALLANLGLAARGRTTELMAVCGVDAEDIADMLAELRALDPKPGLGFAAAPVELAVPDVYVVRAAAGGWTVELNAETLPRVLMNNVYAAKLGRGDVAARAFVSEMSASANWLIRSLEQRARTILKVASRDRAAPGALLRGGGQPAAAADPARGRRPARAARVDGQPGDGGEVSRLRAGELRAALLLQRLDPCDGGRRGLFRDGGAGPHPPPDPGRAAGAHAVGRQNRRGAERRGD